VADVGGKATDDVAGKDGIAEVAAADVEEAIDIACVSPKGDDGRVAESLCVEGKELVCGDGAGFCAGLD
jgi:hypothetical protein